MNSEPEANSPNLEHATEPASGASGSAVPYFLCLAVLLAMAYGGWKWWQVRQFDLARGEAIPANAIGPPLKEFELTERSGKPFRSTEMRGRVWVAAYFFTGCNGQCRRLNASIQALSNMPELKDVTWVSITCDPDNDTLDVLKAYADAYQADQHRWLFCRADLDYAKRVALGMKVYLSYKDHMDRVVVIDKTGKIRGYFDATSSIDCDRMRTLLLKCLAEKAPHDLAVSKLGERKIKLTVLIAAHPIVHVNASLNATATVLLLVGFYLIKKGRVEAHKRAMLTAFAVSIVFLACYVWYHLQVGRVEFTHPGTIRYVYYVILASHVMLAATVPFLAVWQIYLGFRALGCCATEVHQAEQLVTAAAYREKHRRLARITFPIWLYVSVTGVIVYLMLYHLWPPAQQ